MTMSTAPPPTMPTARKSRKRWYFVGGMVALVVAAPFAYVLVAGWAHDRELQAIYRTMDEEDPHWRWADLIAESPQLPDERNAAAQYMKVENLLKVKPFNPGPKWVLWNPTVAYPNARLSHEQAEDLRTGFSRLAPKALEEARQLKDMPEGRPPIDPDANPEPFVNTANIAREAVTVMQLLEYDAILRGHEQDLAGAVDSCRAILNTAHAIGDHPDLAGQQFRMAGQCIAAAAIERILGQGEVSEQDLEQLQSALLLESDHNGLYHGVRAQRATGHEFYLSLRAGKTSVAAFFARLRMMTPKVYNAFPSTCNWELSGYPAHLRQQNKLVRLSKLTDATRTEAMHILVQRPPNLLTGIMICPTNNLLQANERSQTLLRCAVTALAAERFRFKHAHWPRILDDLAKEGLLKELPTDPCNGAPLRWRRSPTGFMVYSVGQDKIDDGGKLHRTDVPAYGTDLGFELWDLPFRHIAPPAEDDGAKKKR